MPDIVEEPVGADVDLDRVALVVERDGVVAAGVVLGARPQAIVWLVKLTVPIRKSRW
jgi:hypothetical protein